VKLYIYIDGLNLYYGCLKDSPYRWLNISQLCSFLFPNDEIVKIKYFTAPIKAVENDDDQDRPNRQQIYLRAIRTISNAEIIEGNFLSHIVEMRRSDGRGLVSVIKNEEKGTDVNIASHLLFDAHAGLFEKAVVISNDSDLVTPVRMVKEGLKLPITIVSPFNHNNIQLKNVATNVKQIRSGVLNISQFPPDMKDSVGRFSIPDKWKVTLGTEDYSFGVILFNKIDKKFLLIKHASDSHWSFPKGHQENEESNLETAKRELSEETGISKAQFLSKRFIESYRFQKDQVAYNKKVTYFVAIADPLDVNVRIQQKEISSYKWVSIQEAVSLITYKETKNIVRKAYEYLTH